MKTLLSNNIIQVILGSFLVLAVFSFVNIEELFVRGQDTASVYPQITLKAAPQDIIYSRAYRTASNTAEVQYAYLDVPAEALPQEDITRRTPVSQTEVLAVEEQADGEIVETLRTTFHSKPQFYERDGDWRQIEYATTTAEEFALSGAPRYVKKREFLERLFGAKPVFAAESTFYPDAHTESSSVDGSISDSNATWSTLRNAASGFVSNDTNATIDIKVGSIGDPTNTYQIARSVVLFDTSSLADNVTVSSSTLSLYVTSKLNLVNDGDDIVVIATSSPASNTALAPSDFGSIGRAALASAVDITSISTSAYLHFSLNATGRAEISLSGVTKFSVQEGHDFNNVDPGITGFSNQVVFSSADETGTAQDPKLVVEYTGGAVTPTFGTHFFDF